MIFHCNVLDISVSDILYHFNGVARGRKEKEAVSGEVLITCPAVRWFSKNYRELLSPICCLRGYLDVAIEWMSQCRAWLPHIGQKASD